MIKWPLFGGQEEKTMTEIILIAFQVAKGLTALFSICAILIKPIRNWLLGIQDRKKEQEEKDSARDEATKCSLRNIITNFYYSKHKVCEIHQYEYENIEKIYHAYKTMGGNSFIDKLWEEIKDWTVIQ